MLEKIDNGKDVSNLTLKEKKQLAKEIRTFLLENVSKTGGHLASNLGVVELTISLLSCFDFDKDKIIFDVGHQSYTYKILTGRKKLFSSLRKYKGLRGFPYLKESAYDFFNTGHSSTSISAALGMARARDLKGENYHIISVIGDGSISNGMSLEAINDLGFNKTKMILILNDNGMSISSNVGGISSYLSRISINERYLKVKNKIKHSLDNTKFGNAMYKVLSRAKDGMRGFLVPSKYFEDMGLTYVGPIDGHDIGLMIKVFERVKRMETPVIIHVVTKKGKGYDKAENDPTLYHMVPPFDLDKGVIPVNKKTYSSYFGEVMLALAEKNNNLVLITAAMCDGVGLVPFAKKFPKRYFDVGISEEHAITMAAGLAASGMRPVFAVYSTFLQRGFDQIVHDVCMQNHPVIFAIDRAGLVGEDGETHQGILDLSYLSIIPNMVIVCPKCVQELKVIFSWALEQKFPIAIRYPKGCNNIEITPIKQIKLGKWEILQKDNTSKVAVIATGRMVESVMSILKNNKLDIMFINATFIKPVDTSMLKKLVKNHYSILTIEDNLLSGGLGDAILCAVNNMGPINIKRMGFSDTFVEQGNIDLLFHQEGLDEKSIIKEIKKLMRNKKIK